MSKLPLLNEIFFKKKPNLIWSPERDLNPRPAVYETAALPAEPPGHTIPTNENECVFLRHSDAILLVRKGSMQHAS